MNKFYILIITATLFAITATAHAQATFNLETGTGTGTGWIWNDPVLTVNDGANITITGAVSNGRRIDVAVQKNIRIESKKCSIFAL